MSFLVDTDICSAFLKGNHAVWQKFMQFSGQLNLSVITVGELTTWAKRKNASPKRVESLQALLDNVAILPVTKNISFFFGEIRAGLLDVGRATPDLDLLIAATAMFHNLTLVTHNTQDFASIVDLNCQDWILN
jgi:tRNA(fMet)-specific endonuclease VapC